MNSCLILMVRLFKVAIRRCRGNATHYRLASRCWRGAVSSLVKSLYPLIESLFHSLIWYSWILLVCVIWGVPSLIHRSCGWYIIDLFWFYGPPWDMSDGSFKFLNLPSLQEPILYTYLFILPSLDCNMGADFARVQVQLVLVDNRYVPLVFVFIWFGIQVRLAHIWIFRQ